MTQRQRFSDGQKKHPGPFRFTISPEESGGRLDQVIASRAPELSRTRAKQIIDLGGVHVGGRRIRRSSQLLQAGDKVEVFLDDAPPEPFRLTDRDILYRDRYLIAVAKPAGVETQPTPARYKGTLYEALLTLLHDPFRPMDRPEIGMVQRLDRETSGVLTFSIHPRSHGSLTRALGEREVRKIYLALVRGCPATGEGEIRTHLARSRGANRVVSVLKGGREAITRFRLLESFGDASLLEVEILTGRSHQIRAHLAESGHPLLGDRRYGGPSIVRGRHVPRQMLHSHKLELRHPVSGDPLLLVAPLPEDLSALLAFLREPPQPVAPEGGV